MERMTRNMTNISDKFMRVIHVNMGFSSTRIHVTVKKTSVVFFGCVYDVNGAHPDPEKVSAVHKMPAPETATQLQKFPQIGNLPVTLHTLTLLLNCIPYVSYWRMEQSSYGTTPIRKHLTKSNQWVARIPHCDTSMSASLSTVQV